MIKNINLRIRVGIVQIILKHEISWNKN